VALGAFLVVVGLGAGLLLTLGNDASSPSAVATDTRVTPSLVNDVLSWGWEVQPRILAYEDAMLGSGPVTNAAQAMAVCAEAQDEVQALRDMRPAPDPIVESEFRAGMAAVEAATAACARGDSATMNRHRAEAVAHEDAMDARIDALTRLAFEGDARTP
jgi:hypothetical protein